MNNDDSAAKKKRRYYSDEGREDYLIFWLMPKMRRLSLSWPAKSIARKKAERFVKIGYFKNGNPKFIKKYECNGCKKLYVREETEMNHVEPVIAVDMLNADWNTRVNRLFCGSTNYECLCVNCHKSITKKQNIKRRMARRKNLSSLKKTGKPKNVKRNKRVSKKRK